MLPDVNGQRCPQCGLIGFLSDVDCRRCGTALGSPAKAAKPGVQATSSHRIIKGVLKICAAVCGVLLIVYLSLLLTSDPLTFEQRQLVDRAIQTLDERGFSGNALLMRRLVCFRATDNW